MKGIASIVADAVFKFNIATIPKEVCKMEMVKKRTRAGKGQGMLTRLVKTTPDEVMVKYIVQQDHVSEHIRSLDIHQIMGGSPVVAVNGVTFFNRISNVQADMKDLAEEFVETIRIGRIR
jgi:hypothetical protein